MKVIVVSNIIVLKSCLAKRNISKIFDEEYFSNTLDFAKKITIITLIGD